jgi:hypothetical protein
MVSFYLNILDQGVEMRVTQSISHKEDMIHVTVEDIDRQL